MFLFFFCFLFFTSLPAMQRRLRAFYGPAAAACHFGQCEHHGTGRHKHICMHISWSSRDNIILCHKCNFKAILPPFMPLFVQSIVNFHDSSDIFGNYSLISLQSINFHDSSGSLVNYLLYLYILLLYILLIYIIYYYLFSHFPLK